jgi:hypothetical protein
MVRKGGDETVLATKQSRKEVIKSSLHPLCPSAWVKFSGCLMEVVGWTAWGKEEKIDFPFSVTIFMVAV